MKVMVSVRDPALLQATLRMGSRPKELFRYVVLRMAMMMMMMRGYLTPSLSGSSSLSWERTTCRSITQSEPRCTS